MISECCYVEDRATIDGLNYSDILECPCCHEITTFKEVSVLEKIKLRKGRIYEIEQIIGGLNEQVK